MLIYGATFQYFFGSLYVYIIYIYEIFYITYINDMYKYLMSCYLELAKQYIYVYIKSQTSLLPQVRQKM